MAEATIKRPVDDGFGFGSIETSAGRDTVMHTSAVQGVRFENLR